MYVSLRQVQCAPTFWPFYLCDSPNKVPQTLPLWSTGKRAPLCRLLLPDCFHHKAAGLLLPCCSVHARTFFSLWCCWPQRKSHRLSCESNPWLAVHAPAPVPLSGSSLVQVQKTRYENYAKALSVFMRTTWWMILLLFQADESQRPWMCLILNVLNLLHTARVRLDVQF